MVYCSWPRNLILFAILTARLTSGALLQAQVNSAEMLLYETTITAEKGKIVRSESYDLLINDRSADYLSRIRVSYSRPNKLSSLEASLHNADGSLIRKISRNEITNQSDISDYSFFEDDYVKKFTLRNSTFPYRIKWSYTIQATDFVTVCDWMPVIGSKYPTRKARLVTILPEDYTIRVDSSGIGNYTYQKVENKIVRTWECSFLETYDEEVLQEDDVEVMPYVWVVPEEFYFVTDGRQGTWKEFGLWCYKLTKDLYALPEVDKKIIQTMKNENLPAKELIRKLYNYVQDKTRYLNVSLETGGLQPYPALYVSNNGYGDCKALSVYMQALLAEAGIPSAYTLVSAGESKPDINVSFVANQFNHAIIVVPLEGDSIWIDATSDNPFGYIGSFIQNRHALVTGSEGGTIVKIPAITNNQVIERRNGTIHISPDLISEINLKIGLGGKNAELIRSIESSLDLNDKKRIIERVVRIPFFESSMIEIAEHSRHNERIELSYSGESNNFLKSYGNNLILPVIPVDLPLLEPPDERITKLKLPFPTCQSDSILIDIPSKYKLNYLPEFLEIKSECGYYAISYIKEEHGIHFIRQFSLNAGTFSGEKYQALFAFIKQIRKIESSGAISFSK